MRNCGSKGDFKSLQIKSELLAQMCGADYFGKFDQIYVAVTQFWMKSFKMEMSDNNEHC